MTADSYRPLSSITPKASEMLGRYDSWWGDHRPELPTREQARRARDGHAEKLRRQRAAQIEVSVAREAIGKATGLRRVILTLHGPEFGWDKVSLVCGGCDRGDGYDCGDAAWPCTTWTRTLEHEGP